MRKDGAAFGSMNNLDVLVLSKEPDFMHAAHGTAAETVYGVNLSAVHQCQCCTAGSVCFIAVMRFDQRGIPGG